MRQTLGPQYKPLKTGEIIHATTPRLCHLSSSTLNAFEQRFRVSSLHVGAGEARASQGGEMSQGSIVLVHGTGVRLKSYKSTFDKVTEIAAANGIKQPFVECAWGDPLGVEFAGLSLPDEPDAKEMAVREEDFARWNWLFDDPLFELDKLTIRDTSNVVKPVPRPGAKPVWLKLWEEIEAYQPSRELTLLLERGGLEDLWPEAWLEIVKGSGVPKAAFEASAHELPDACRALARASVAQVHVLAATAERPGPSRILRNALIERLMDDWKQKVYGLGAFLAELFKRAATSIARHYRAGMSAGAALPLGDILPGARRSHPRIHPVENRESRTSCQQPER